MNEEQLDFIRAVDEYRRLNDRPFPTCTELLDILLYLGYRRVAPIGEYSLIKPRQNARRNGEDRLEEQEAFSRADELDAPDALDGLDALNEPDTLDVADMPAPDGFDFGEDLELAEDVELDDRARD